MTQKGDTQTKRYVRKELHLAVEGVEETACPGFSVTPEVRLTDAAART